MRGMGFSELLLIFGIGILLFGHRLPSLAKNFGLGVRNFKQAMDPSEDSLSVDVSQFKEGALLPPRAISEGLPKLPAKTNRGSHHVSRPS